MTTAPEAIDYSIFVSGRAAPDHGFELFPRDGAVVGHVQLFHDPLRPRPPRQPAPDPGVGQQRFQLILADLPVAVRVVVPERRPVVPAEAGCDQRRNLLPQLSLLFFARHCRSLLYTQTSRMFSPRQMTPPV